MATTSCGHEPVCANDLCRKCYNRAYTLQTVEKRKARYNEKRDEIRAKAAVYRASRREEAAARSREWRKQNPGRRLRQWKPTTPEQIAKVKATSAAWAAANRERKAAAANRRRARETAGADLTTEQWIEILARFDGHCAYCDRADAQLVMEHMTPLARGGRHTASNVVPACAPCNLRKHTKTAEEFAGRSVPPRLQMSEAS